LNLERSKDRAYLDLNPIYVFYRAIISQTDGDSKAATFDADATEAELAKLKEILTVKNYKIALAAIFATKLNWWATNHHTGTPRLQGYSRKVAIALLNLEVRGEDVTASLMHTIGHWVSTKRILTLLGIKGIKKVEPFVAGDAITLTPTEDVTIRSKSMPAGTHRHVVAYAVIRRLSEHIIAPFSPVLLDVSGILVRIEEVMKNPVRYHVGASYLTGKKAHDFADTDANHCLGRLGTFIRHFAPKSTIAKSPHLSIPGTVVNTRNFRDID